MGASRKGKKGSTNELAGVDKILASASNRFSSAILYKTKDAEKKRLRHTSTRENGAEASLRRIAYIRS